MSVGSAFPSVMSIPCPSISTHTSPSQLDSHRTKALLPAFQLHFQSTLRLSSFQLCYIILFSETCFHLHQMHRLLFRTSCYPFLLNWSHSHLWCAHPVSLPCSSAWEPDITSLNRSVLQCQSLPENSLWPITLTFQLIHMLINAYNPGGCSLCLKCPQRPMCWWFGPQARHHWVRVELWYIKPRGRSSGHWRHPLKQVLGTQDLFYLWIMRSVGLLYHILSSDRQQAPRTDSLCTKNSQAVTLSHPFLFINWSFWVFVTES